MTCSRARATNKYTHCYFTISLFSFQKIVSILRHSGIIKEFLVNKKNFKQS